MEKIYCTNPVNTMYLVLNLEPLFKWGFANLKHKGSFCEATVSISIFSELEIRLNESETEKFNIKQMKDLFEQKAAQLATEIVGRFAGKFLPFIFMQFVSFIK